MGTSGHLKPDPYWYYRADRNKMQNQGLWGQKKKTNNIQAMSMDLELPSGREVVYGVQILIVATRHWGFMPGFKFYLVFGLSVK